MAGLLPNVDPDGLLEFSVVYTDRSLNHMSKAFQGVMTDLHKTLTSVYNAEHAVIVPGGGTFGMEAVARQFAQNAKTLVVRNGWFSFRWTQILDAGNFVADSEVRKASPKSGRAFTPAPIEDVVAAIRAEKPAVVFAPHVETSAGMMLPDSYIKTMADAAHEVGALLVIDCIASGCIWLDMADLGIDVLVSAPQKGWSGTPCAGLVMLSANAVAKMTETSSDSFAIDLKKWSDIMNAYLGGGHAYHATMPTDSLRAFRDITLEMAEIGYDELKSRQQALGDKVRALLESKGIDSVAGEGFQAPGVVVSYTADPGIKSGKKFADIGVQIAAGVPLQCDEPADFQTFRLGLFGLDKLKDVDATVARLSAALEQVL